MKYIKLFERCALFNDNDLSVEIFILQIIVDLLRLHTSGQDEYIHVDELENKRLL